MHATEVDISETNQKFSFLQQNMDKKAKKKSPKSPCTPASRESSESPCRETASTVPVIENSIELTVKFLNGTGGDCTSMNPFDIKRLGLKSGSPVVIRFECMDKPSRTILLRAWMSHEVDKGTVHLSTQWATNLDSETSGRSPLKIAYSTPNSSRRKPSHVILSRPSARWAIFFILILCSYVVSMLQRKSSIAFLR